MSQPKKDPFLPDDRQPLMECMTCGHYRKSEKDGLTDWSSGKCLHSGLDPVPPRHVCSAWCKDSATLTPPAGECWRKHRHRNVMPET